MRGTTQKRNLEFFVCGEQRFLVRHHHVVDASSNIHFIFFKTGCSIWIPKAVCHLALTHASHHQVVVVCLQSVYAVFVFQSFHRLSFQQNSVIDNRLLFGFFCNIFTQMTAENDAPSNDEQKAKKTKGTSRTKPNLGTRVSQTKENHD